MKIQNYLSLALCCIFFILKFTLSSVASDAKKVTLVLKEFPSEEEKICVENISSAFEKYDSFEYIDSDSLVQNLSEVENLDSLKALVLHQKKIHAALFCQPLTEPDSHRVTIEVVFADSVLSNSNFVTEVNLSDSSSVFDSLAQKIHSVFWGNEKQTKLTRVLVIEPVDSLSSEVSDSLWISLKESLATDSVDETLTFSVNLIQMNTSNDSSLLHAANENEAELVLTGRFVSKTDSVSKFAPVLLVLGGSDKHSASLDELNAIKGKTCRLTKIDLPEILLNDINPLTRFIAAHFALGENNYVAIMNLLDDADHFPGLFYLSEAFLSQGVQRERDIALARADWDSSLFFLKKCLDFEISSRDTVFVNNNLGVAYQLLGNLDSALVYFSRANQKLNHIKDHRERLRISGNYGNILLLSGQWKQALDIFQASMEDMKAADDTLTLALTYENLGNIYQLILQRNRAIQYYNQALELRRAMQDDAGAAITLLYLGNVFHEKQEYQAAKNYYLQGLEVYRQTHNEPGIADTHDRLGQVFSKLQEPDSAVYYFQQSMNIMSELDDRAGLVRTMIHLASVYSHQKKFDEAMDLYERALPIANSGEIKSLSAQIYDRIGDIYNNRDQLIAAFDNYEEATALYEQVGNMESLSLILYSMGLIRLKQNDYGEGYQLMKRAIDLDDQHGFFNLSGEREFLRELQIIMESNPNN